MDEDRLPSDVLYLACTRPALKWGVPFEGWCLNFTASYFAFLYIGRLNLASARGIICLLAFPIIHVAMKILTDIDHNVFRVLRLAVITRGIQLRGLSILWAAPWKRDLRKAQSAI